MLLRNFQADGTQADSAFVEIVYEDADRMVTTFRRAISGTGL